jgi:hypothetical protein
MPYTCKVASSALPLTAADSDDLFDLTFDVDVQDLQNLDAAIERD